jgi:DNA-directed RNA polymerase subunit beta'
VAELFEARAPKEAAEIAKIDGVVDLQGTSAARRSSSSRIAETRREEHLIPLSQAPA